MARRPKFSNKLGIPHRSEGSDGDIQVRQTNLGAKLFGKIGGKWSSAFLSSEEEILGTSGTKIGMDSSGALSVDQINLTGKIKITSAGLKNVCVGINNSDLGQQNVLIGVDAGKSIGATTVGADIGFQNTCIGNLAGDSIDGGYFNTLVGYGAGDEITSGDSNVCIGFGTGGSTTGGDNICIGKGATVGTGVDGNIVLGVSCSSSATGGIVLGGAFTAVTGSGGIAIGTGSTAAANGIAIGVSIAAGENETVIGTAGVFKFKSKEYTCDIADGEDAKSASTDASPILLPAYSIIKSISVFVNQLSNLGTFNVALYHSTDDGAVADDTTLGGTPVEVLGAGVAATLSGTSASAVDIALGTSAGVVKTGYYMDEGINVGSADRYIHVGNAGTGNGDTNPSTSGKIKVLVEYIGLD